MSQDAQSPSLGVPVTLDKLRHLRFTLGTRRVMMEEFGGEEGFKRDMTGEKLGRILWYGLKWEDSTLTVQAVEDMVDLQNLQKTLELLLKAMGYKGQAITTGDEDPRPPRAPAEEIPVSSR
jgi:hypothetical protein